MSLPLCGNSGRAHKQYAGCVTCRLMDLEQAADRMAKACHARFGQMDHDLWVKGIREAVEAYQSLRASGEK